VGSFSGQIKNPALTQWEHRPFIVSTVQALTATTRVRERPVANAGLGDMINYENLIGMPVDKLNCLRKVLFEDQDVVP
jgi:hypothetical protein